MHNLYLFKQLGILDEAKLATCNVRSLGNKEVELNKILKESKIDIMGVTQTNKKLNGTVEFENIQLYIAECLLRCSSIS